MSFGPALTARTLSALLIFTGSMHFLKPAPMVAIVPRSLRRPEMWVAVSGVAELGCAALIAVPCTRRLWAAAAAVVFVTVFQANVSMALRSKRRQGWYRALCWLRLPLQWPLVSWALRVARTAKPIIE